MSHTKRAFEPFGGRANQNNRIDETLTAADQTSKVAHGGALLRNPLSGNRIATTVMIPSDGGTYSVDIEASPDAENWSATDTLTNTGDRVNVVRLSPQLYYRFKATALTGSVRVVMVD